MREPIDAVIFDYGGVLSTSPFARLRSAEQALGLRPGTLSELLGYGLDVPEPAEGEPYTNPWHLLEIGAIGLDEYADWVRDNAVRLLGGPIDVRPMMADGFATMAIHWSMVHLARRLRARGLRLAVCSNNIAAHRGTWQSQVPIELFDVVVDSSDVGLRKPDPAIYRLTCEQLGVPPERCGIVDDIPKNVRTAERLGMRAVLVGEDIRGAVARIEQLASGPEGAGSAGHGN